MADRILITGGAGFIGSFLAERLLQEGCTVRVLDSLDPQVHPGGQPPGYLHKECELIRADIRDRETVRKALHDVDAVVHLAARVGLGQSQYEIHAYTDVNISGTANLLDHWVNRYRDRIRKVIVASSMSIYGEGLYRCSVCGPKTVLGRTSQELQPSRWEPVCSKCSAPLCAMPTPETHTLNGSSVYAITKRVQEEMVLSVGKTYGLPVVALRFFNVYGPRQSLSNPYTGVLSMFLSRIKNNRPPILFEDGLQSRDFVSVHDVCDVIERCLKNEQLVHDTFNLGSGQARAIRSIAETLAKQLDQKVKPDVTNRYRKGDIRHCFADTTRLQNKTGFEVSVSFEERLKEVIEWARKEDAQDRTEQAHDELKRRGLV